MSSSQGRLFQACREKPPSFALIRPLVEANPSIVKEKDTFDRTPLQIALGRRASLDLVVCLVNAWPDSVKQTYSNGSVPLHIAAGCCTLDVVQFLVAQWHESVKCKTRDGRLPLDYAIAGGTLEVIKFLHETWKESLEVVDVRFGNPLSRCIECCRSPAVIRYVATQKPALLTMAHPWNRYIPLHQAVIHYKASEMVPVLLEMCPEAVKMKTKDGSLPVHLAASVASPLISVLQILIQEWPDSLLQEDNMGNLPLHRLVEMKEAVFPRPSTLNLLVDANPSAIHCQNRQGLVPLQLFHRNVGVQHTCAGYHRAHEIIALLVDDRDWHFVCKFFNLIPKHILKRLLQDRQDSIFEEDNDGLFPWQVASLYDCCSVEWIFELLRRCPETLKQ